ncbi:MAG TPA: FHA domain-containing protein [Oceanobacillus sp.]|nr:FHA domain-containing protein [Oceanobacillus sp.]
MPEFELRSDEGVVYRLDTPTVQGYILGRSDEHSDFAPDVDLANYGARDKGVSRRHAALVRYHGRLHILDLNSVNGTFLNGTRLLSDNPYPVSAGDEIRIGTLNLRIERVKN